MTNTEVAALKVDVREPAHRLSAELTRPANADRLLVLAHGAGADFRHANMLGISEGLARQGIASLRFNFPFMEEGRRRVDSQATSIACVLAALTTARDAAPDLPLYLGGHSYGGRMASHAVLEPDAPALAGLVFCSFPLHPPKKPGTDRAAHLPDVELPMLFLSGTRDGLATPELLEALVDDLPRATLHWLDTADHGYKILKRTRQSEEDVFDELARVAAGFMRS